MRIGIAARGLSEISGGAKQFIESITDALLSIDKQNQYFIFYNTNKHKGKFPNTEEIVLPSKNKLIWDYLKLPKAIKTNKIDVCLFLKNVIPFNVHCKSIVAILDLLHIKDPKVYKFYDSLYMKFFISLTLKKADAIIAISNNTKKDLIEYSNVDEKKVSVIYLAADKKYKNIPNINKKRLEDKYGIKFPFILYIGSLSPRKNLPCLIKAFRKLKKQTDLQHKLVIGGGKKWKADEIIKTVDGEMKKDIIFTGHIDDQDVPFLYNLADLFVYPSFYEGFGLPILEAMACNCPVICSNTSSMLEVGGDAAIYFNPYNYKELTEKIIKVLKDKELKNQLITLGQKNILKFSWKKTAYKILNLLNHI